MHYHVLAGSDDGNSFSVVFHVPIPAVNNRVGISYRTALVNSGLGGKTVMVEGNAAGQITTAEKNQIVAGELYEHSESFNTNPGETATVLRDRIDARYQQLVSVVQGQVQSRLSYFGFQRNVP